VPRQRLDSEKVIDAAARLSDQGGLGSVSLTELAAELKVRPPSLYFHVEGIDDVWRRLGVRGLRMLGAELGTAIEGLAGVDALRAFAAAYRDFAHAHPGLYEASQRSHELADNPDAVAAGEEVVGVALRMLRGYALTGDDAVHAVRTIRAGLHGFVTLEEGGGFAWDLPVDETFERLVTLLDAGLASKLLAGGRSASRRAG
jgi:AcrR family transcriptional regulator